VVREQPCKPFGHEALALGIDERIVAIEFLAELGTRIIRREQRH
jgi:hypothetical protein